MRFMKLHRALKAYDTLHLRLKACKTMTTDDERYHVFLGGSCGGRKSPTTWRKEVAIPLLQENQVKFFNPQVDMWSLDLMHKENSAKDHSDWLLFVLEATTRGLASLVEVAHLVGLGRSVVFVLQKEREIGKIDIPDDFVSSREMEDICCSQALLHAIIAHNSSSKYCSVLKDGLQHVINALKQGSVVVSGSSSSLCGGCTSSHGGGTGSFDKKRIQEFVDKLLASLTPKRRRSRLQGQCLLSNLRLSIPTPIESLVTRRHQKALVIIGADSIDNMASMAEEKLRHRGLDDPLVLVEKDTVIDLHTLSSCLVLLAYIPSSSLSCSAMCKVAYMASRRSDIVVCIQDLAQNIAMDNTTLSPGAISDYNRARAYLREIAQRSKVHVFADLDPALDTACERAIAGTRCFDTFNNNKSRLLGRCSFQDGGSSDSTASGGYRDIESALSSDVGAGNSPCRHDGVRSSTALPSSP